VLYLLQKKTAVGNYSLKNNEITILLVEQNVQKLLSIAHRAYVSEGRRITMEGTGKNLLSDPYVEDAYLGL
jgi:branched-chain amino acid transport system ATP-binding protein